MTESKAETATKPAKELLALNPKQESEFKKKVQEAKKNKSSKVGRDGKCGLEIHVTRIFNLYLFTPTKVTAVTTESITLRILSPNQKFQLT